MCGIVGVFSRHDPTSLRSFTGRPKASITAVLTAGGSGLRRDGRVAAAALGRGIPFFINLCLRGD